MIGGVGVVVCYFVWCCEVCFVLTSVRMSCVRMTTKGD